MKHAAVFFLAMFSLHTFAMDFLQNSEVIELTDSAEIKCDWIKFLRSDGLAAALEGLRRDQVSDLISSRDASAYRNPPLLHLVANAKVKQAMILLNTLGNSESIFDLVEADAQGFNNPLTMAIAKGSDYFDNKYKNNPVKNDDEMAILIEHLIKVYPQINWRNKHGNTALHFAYLRRDKNLVDALLSAGANPTIQNDEGLFPDQMKFKSTDKANYLLERQVGGMFFSELTDRSSSRGAKRCRQIAFFEVACQNAHILGSKKVVSTQCIKQLF